MSKQALHLQAERGSGITYAQSNTALQLRPSMYERLGKEDGVRRLSEIFYERVFALSDNGKTDLQWFLNIFSSSTKEEAIDNQYRFLVQTFGGPDLYKEKKGKYSRLVGRHANYSIGTAAARTWVKLMEEAIDEHEQLRNDDETRKHLKQYFAFQAHYIVAAMAYMRSDQLSGGTSMDSGRVW